MVAQHSNQQHHSSQHLTAPHLILLRVCTSRYRHIHTGERALVALCRDANTGVRLRHCAQPADSRHWRWHWRWHCACHRGRARRASHAVPRVPHRRGSMASTHPPLPSMSCVATIQSPHSPTCTDCAEVHLCECAVASSLWHRAPQTRGRGRRAGINLL